MPMGGSNAISIGCTGYHWHDRFRRRAGAGPGCRFSAGRVPDHSPDRCGPRRRCPEMRNLARPKVAGFSMGSSLAKTIRKGYAPASNGIEECRAQDTSPCLGGQHGYRATILAGRSTVYLADKRRACCSAILIPVYHQGERRNAGTDWNGRSADRGLCRNCSG